MVHSSGIGVYVGLFDADPPSNVMATRWERFLIWWAVVWYWRDHRKNFKPAPSRLKLAMKKSAPCIVPANEIQLWKVANDDQIR